MPKRTLILFLIFLLIGTPVMATTPWTTKPPLGSQINWSHPLSKGLVGAWLMNEGGGGVAKNIADGLSYPLENTTTWGFGVKGVAYKPSGNDRINLGTDDRKFEIGSQKTILVKSILNDVTSDHCFISKFSTLANEGEWLIQFDDASGFSSQTDRINFVARMAGGVNVIAESSAVVSNKTYDICLTHSVGVATNLYINGSLDNAYSLNSGGIIGDNNTNVACIGNTSALNKDFNGLIYFVYIWNRVLSPSEIKSLYESPYQFIEYKPWTLWGAISQEAAVVIQNLRNAFGQGIGSGIGQGAR